MKKTVFLLLDLTMGTNLRKMLKITINLDTSEYKVKYIFYDIFLRCLITEKSHVIPYADSFAS